MVDAACFMRSQQVEWRAIMTETLSRKLARFAVNLTYKDMPEEVRDKVKARILHAIGTGLAAHDDATYSTLKRLVIAEESLAQGGARLLADGTRVTRAGAASANCSLMSVRNQHDSYRMLTHPGCQVVPAALAVAEGTGCSGEDVTAAVAAGLEVLVRIASNPEFIPAIQAHGFRSSPIHAVFGAAVAAGKLLGLNEDQMVHAIALAATSACGTVEGARARGGETPNQDPIGTRNGVWAAMLSKAGVTGAESALEGPGGFYHAFSGRTDWDFSSVTDGLGTRYELANITSKQWPQTGYIQTPIWLATALAQRHDIRPETIDQIRLELYFFETTYPSPAFANPPIRGIASTAFGVATAVVHKGYPQYGPTTNSVTNMSLPTSELEANPVISKLIDRIELVPSRERQPYFPKMTVILKDGTTYEDELNGREILRFGLKEEGELMDLLAPGLPIPKTQFDQLVYAINHLEEQSSIDQVVSLTIPPRQED